MEARSTIMVSAEAIASISTSTSASWLSSVLTILSRNTTQAGLARAVSTPPHSLQSTCQSSQSRQWLSRCTPWTSWASTTAGAPTQTSLQGSRPSSADLLVSKGNWAAAACKYQDWHGHIIHQLAHKHQIVDQELGTSNNHKHLGQHTAVLLVKHMLVHDNSNG